MSLPIQEIHAQIKSVCRIAANPLEHVARFGAEAIHEFDFDLSNIQDFREKDIRQSVEHQADFQRLAAIKGPVVYVFEVTSGHSGQEVLRAAKAYASGKRAMPAFRKSAAAESVILYVGKVKRNFWGRVIQHLGFYKVTATQGLQLFHWGKDIGLKVKITVFEFREDMAELMPLLENALAHSLQPLIGKHK